MTLVIMAANSIVTTATYTPWIVSTQNAHADTLTPSATVSGDRILGGN